MNVFGKEIYVMMIKVFSKKEYRNDFINGHMYLNESGYFNKLDDNYRGDKYDSQIIEKDATIFVNGIELHPDIMTQGFVGDEKIPILCMTILNETALTKTADNKFKIKQCIIDELSKFGEYALLFYYGELSTNLNNFVKEKGWAIDQDVVTYVDMSQNKDYLKLYYHDRFNKYFVKDISYKNQNEARIILASKSKKKFEPLISNTEHHIEFDIVPLQTYFEFDIRKNIEFEIRKDAIK